ncbi:MAG: hypothetical protein JNG90_09760 [Planctomycetaceae bacterium]|nr:hypothetical protein [Planctomycetaceae bacterium]
MIARLSVLALHLVLLVLAASAFTSATAWLDGHLRWESYRYVWQRGWGREYAFPYSLAVVLTYLGAYAVGVVAYGQAARRGSPILGALGLLLCGVGFASFPYELTHWFSDRYGSWIATAPAALIVVGVLTMLQQFRIAMVQRSAQRSTSEPQSPSRPASA